MPTAGKSPLSIQALLSTAQSLLMDDQDKMKMVSAYPSPTDYQVVRNVQVIAKTITVRDQQTETSDGIITDIDQGLRRSQPRPQLLLSHQGSPTLPRLLPTSDNITGRSDINNQLPSIHHLMKHNSCMDGLPRRTLSPPVKPAIKKTVPKRSYTTLTSQGSIFNKVPLRSLTTMPDIAAQKESLLGQQVKYPKKTGQPASLVSRYRAFARTNAATNNLLSMRNTLTLENDTLPRMHTFELPNPLYHHQSTLSTISTIEKDPLDTLASAAHQMDSLPIA